MTRVEMKDFVLSYKDDPNTKDVVFKKVLDFFIKHEVFSGECIYQCDAFLIDGPELLSTLADEVFQFDVQWKE